MTLLFMSLLFLAQAGDSVIDRPLATRAALEAAAQRLAADRSDHAATLLGRVRTRLAEGDFHAGDAILLSVQAESTLSDTFIVGASRELLLPSPTVGTLSLRGVLRSELQDTLVRYLGQFIMNPIARAQPLIRLSVQGEVTRAGIHLVPVSGTLGDAITAAGGTTQFADVRKVRIMRDGTPLGDSRSLELSIDWLALRDGDGIVVAGHRPGEFSALHVTWLLVSITAGVLALSRHF